MNLKEYFENIDLDEINRFIENRVTEDLYMDFKTANYPIELKFDNKNFSKCLSGFANSSGGLIIWGVKASKNKEGLDVAKELKPISDLIKFENHLKRIEGKSVVPVIEGIEYRSILSSKDTGFLVVFVPPSDRTPHMALYADKHYYKRSGDSFYICEHFDIMDMINRKRTPKLSVELRNEQIEQKTKNNEVKYKYKSIFTINNVSQVSAKHLAVSLKVYPPFNIAKYGIDGNGHRGMNSLPTNEDFIKYNGGSELVLHPESFHEVDKIVLNEIGWDNYTSDLTLEYKVFAENMIPLSGKITRKSKDLFD